MLHTERTVPRFCMHIRVTRDLPLASVSPLLYCAGGCGRLSILGARHPPQRATVRLDVEAVPPRPSTPVGQVSFLSRRWLWETLVANDVTSERDARAAWCDLSLWWGRPTPHSF